MIKKYNTLSFVWGVPGILIQIVGCVLRPLAEDQQIPPPYDNLGGLMILLGSIALLIGFVYYAKAKGRSAWWCLFGFLSLIGLLVLACLKDKTLSGENVPVGEKSARPASSHTFTILVILLVALVLASILAFVLLPFVIQASRETEHRTNAVNTLKLLFDTYSGYFVSNKFEPDAAESFAVVTSQEQFDKVFGVAAVMSDKSHRLAKDAFKSSVVMAAIKRGNAVWEFKVEGMTMADGTVALRYTTTSQKSDSATFASPLIVSIPKGKYTAVRFVENGKTVKTVDVVQK